MADTENQAVNAWLDDGDVRLFHGDALDVLRELPDESVHCIATSPPFYALRDYGVDGQIGLEDSPDEWAARLVDVFREARRVLAADGSCWIECGDSYASNTAGRGNPNEGHVPNAWQHRDVGIRTKGGAAFTPMKHPTKQKDLLGTPWLLARMLRDPYYTGRIKDERDRIWLAAMVEAEGCIYIHRRPAGQESYSKYERVDGTTANYRRTQDTFGPGVQVSNTDRLLLERCRAIAGVGQITESKRGRARVIYRWCVLGQQARDLLRELYPHFVVKHHEARLAYGCPSNGAKATEAHGALKLLHQGNAVSADFKPPESLLEPGWYLRGAYIWSKSNCMPESAKDRCTTAHSYVFHLSKSARYWFDGEAISEPAAWERWGDQTVPKHEGTDTAAGWIKPKGKNELLADISGNGAHRTRAGFNERWDTTVAENGYPASKHPRSVWTIPTQGYPEAHFATWPEALARRIILAGCREGGTVLDPFAGSGTTLLVARKHQRRAIGIDLNETYLQLAARRLQQLSLLADGAA